ATASPGQRTALPLHRPATASPRPPVAAAPCRRIGRPASLVPPGCRAAGLPGSGVNGLAGLAEWRDWWNGGVGGMVGWREKLGKKTI
ncbi:MAG TPA: hypothetical protein PKG95_04735, partial [Anaerolineaceae bacterium]|nr:hypothetical protein [Anaerolineaceae bacterium]